MIGDTILFTNKEKVEIKISGRTKYYLNVVGSQLSEFQMISLPNGKLLLTEQIDKYLG